MTIIAIDLSMSNTGIAIFSDDGHCKKLMSIATNKGDSHPQRLKTIATAMQKIKKEYKPTLIVCEESFTRFNKSTHSIYKCRGVMELVFYNVPMKFYHSTTIRKIVLGKGNADKEMVREYILSKYKNVKFDDLDQSDAYAIFLAFAFQEGILKP